MKVPVRGRKRERRGYWRHWGSGGSLAGRSGGHPNVPTLWLVVRGDSAILVLIELPKLDSEPPQWPLEALGAR